MKYNLFLAVMAIALAAKLPAQEVKKSRDVSSGSFSLGTRNTFSMFNHDGEPGKGIGGQFRLQVNDRFNTEWFMDYITSKNEHYTVRNDYHVGWSVMYYPGKKTGFDSFLKPYFLAGHCFDMAVVREQANKENSEKQTSMATQLGLGTHLNITPKFDCSLSAQYMMHFGRDIHTHIEGETVEIEKHNFSSPDGHLLFTVSFNYKFADLFGSSPK